jgi:hypothetical protein
MLPPLSVAMFAVVIVEDAIVVVANVDVPLELKLPPKENAPVTVALVKVAFVAVRPRMLLELALVVDAYKFEAKVVARFEVDVAVSDPIVALPIVATPAVSESKNAERMRAKFANSPAAVDVPVMVDEPATSEPKVPAPEIVADATVMPLVTVSDVAVALPRIDVRKFANSEMRPPVVDVPAIVDDAALMPPARAWLRRRKDWSSMNLMLMHCH